ncbi:outer membrane protein assembly factor BamB family protein [Halopiger goleimassiliensis]|uniref:outer membrane protein assembly factor BamB family protein n=1 Tax=Halopiger goleimassiliensis TaxID=1293048 RepID=UPI0009DBB013|nr:PQQ-binding-like beta-propeller repeat protein [Halopiger goleimassiliensis]
MPLQTRRRLLELTGAAVAGGLLAGCTTRGASADELESIGGAWPVDGADDGRTRTVEDAPTDPDVVWTTDLEGARSAGTSSVADERCYVPVDAVSDLNRHRHRLHALDARTGEERWRVPLRAELNGPPAVEAGRIVVSGRPETERGRIAAFGERYGDEEWLYDVDARVTAPPTIGVTTVYCPDWAGRVHALSIVDGAVRWSRSIGDDGNRQFAGPAAIDDDTLYLGAQSGRTGVIAVDAETGDELWSRSTGPVTAGPVVDGDLVVVQSHSLVSAFDADGTERWEYNVPEARSTPGSYPLAVDDRHVYVATRDRLHAIDRRGERAWAYDTTADATGPPTVAGDAVLLAEDGQLTAVSRATGDAEWTVDTDGTGPVVTTPGGIFVRTPNGRVTALGTA